MGLKGGWYGSLNHIPNQKKNFGFSTSPIPPITECLHISFIRPLPPPHAAGQTYKLHDVVDAFHLNGWWKGTVSKVGVLEDNSKCRRYSVVLENQYQELDFSSRDLRFHLDWNDGKWDHLPNQSPNQHQAGSDSRMEESSKKSERELDAEVAAAESQMVLENPFQELGFSSADLRVHMDRADGTWLRPPKQEIINIEEDCEKQSEHDDDKTAYLSKVVHEKDKSSRKRGREMNAQVTRQKVAAAVDQEEEKQTSVKKSRENPLEQSASRNTTSTAKKQNMPAPETEETVPNNSNKFRMENCPNILSRDECRTTLMSMDSTEKVTESARAKCSTFGTNGNGMAESSNKRGRGLNAPVPATAAEEDKTNEGSAEVINGGSVQNFNQSSAVNVKAESEPVRDKNLPFVKSSYMWKEFDSQEVFRILPQTPHFSHLSDCHEETREGLAIGHMVTFASVVEKVSKLQIEDPTSHFVSYLEALDILQEIGFDVKAVVDRVNDLLSLKTRQEQFHEHSKTYQSLVVECDEKKAKLEEENTAIDKMIGELEAKRAANVSQIVKEDSTRDFLQLRASTIEDFMLDMKKKFKVKSAAPWQRLI